MERITSDDEGQGGTAECLEILEASHFSRVNRSKYLSKKEMKNASRVPALVENLSIRLL